MSSGLAVVMLDRHIPSRPMRLGTRRRSARQGGRTAVAGGHVPAKRATSLDTQKHLATSVREWMGEQRSDLDVYREKRALHRQLTHTYHEIWQQYARATEASEDEDERKDLFKARARWEKRWMRVLDCQSEWIGYRAECCKSQTTPIAVPVGCNDRMCPLCSHHRSAKAQRKLRTMFDRLEHPVLITLTVPNQSRIRKHTYELFRQRVRKFIAQHKGWIRGGVYSLETTYNRQEKTWHVHAHILADIASSLPAKSDKVTLAGMKMYRFRAMKLRLEFDWFRLWRTTWGKKPRTDAKAQARMGDEYTFEKWVELCHRMRQKEWRNGSYQQRTDLSPAEMQMCFDWNRENRMVVDIKPVDDRNRAAREVLKYIAKTADFIDLPEAVETFCDAVRGARLIQTFGSWYGVKLDDPADPEHVHDWGDLTCACGVNDWKRLGVFHHKDVEMDAGGRWRLRRPHDWKSAGTVPRPTIRALDVREGAPLSYGTEDFCTGIELETR